MLDESKRHALKEFDHWLINIGNGTFDISIPNDITVKSLGDDIRTISYAIYPNLIGNYTDLKYL